MAIRGMESMLANYVENQISWAESQGFKKEDGSLYIKGRMYISWGINWTGFIEFYEGEIEFYEGKFGPFKNSMKEDITNYMSSIYDSMYEDMIGSLPS